MTNSHEAVAIAQTVFYAPVVPIAFYVFIRNWSNGPRLAWYPLVPFSLIRIFGGILVIVLSSNPNSIGLTIAAIVLLNIGLIPLIISTVGLIGYLLNSSSQDNSIALRIVKVVRIAIAAAIGLLVSSGILAGQPSTANTAKTLAQAAYILFAVILGIIMAMLIRLHRQKNMIATGDFIYVKGATFAMPALVLRTIYGLFYEFASDSIFSIWSPLFGSAAAFFLMALLPEFLVLVIYAYLGFHRIHSRSKEIPDSNNDSILKDNRVMDDISRV